MKQKSYKMLGTSIPWHIYAKLDFNWTIVKRNTVEWNVKS